MTKLIRLAKGSYAHALIIGTAVILFWRGVWGLFDLYLFPDNLLLRYLVSLILGLAILITTHTLVKELE